MIYVPKVLYDWTLSRKIRFSNSFIYSSFDLFNFYIRLLTFQDLVSVPESSVKFGLEDHFSLRAPILKVCSKTGRNATCYQIKFVLVDLLTLESIRGRDGYYQHFHRKLLAFVGLNVSRCDKFRTSCVDNCVVVRL
jgi:hypothetical protein